jgi:hypothetical protein
MARGPLAGAAGPGKFSVRTDGLSLPSSGYGEGVETAAIKSAAPLAKTPDVRGATPTDVRQATKAAPVTSLYAPTERPGEPVTTGIALGAGAGPEVIGMNQMPTEDDLNFRANIQAYMPVLSYVASLPGTSPETRKAIRQLKDSL